MVKYNQVSKTLFGILKKEFTSFPCQNTTFAIKTNFMKAPLAPIRSTILEKHGHQRMDPYFWMNQRDSEDVLSYIEAENAYSKAYFEPHAEIIETLLDEYQLRIPDEDTGAPYFQGGRKWQWKFEAGADFPDWYEWTETGMVKQFDQEKRAQSFDFYELEQIELAPNQQLLAWSEDTVGRRNYSILFRQEETKEIVSESIENTDGSFVWHKNSSGLFYVKKDAETLREFQVYFHSFGSNSSEDTLIWEENDALYNVSISGSISEEYLVISSESSTTSKVLLFHFDSNQLNEWGEVNQGVLRTVEHHPNGFYCLTNEDAPNKKITFQSSNEEKANLICAHDSSSYIEDFLVFEHHLAILKRKNGLPFIQVLDLKGNLLREIEQKEEAFEIEFYLNSELKSSCLYYSYTSLSTPKQVFEHHLEKGDTNIFFEKSVPDPSFSSENYLVKRIWATAYDGEQIPISLIHHRSTKTNEAPLLLYGYGSYGITIPTQFSPTRLSLLNRGFVYAIAHIRGGKMLGEHWYENGKFLKKMNTFTDFISAADYLALKGFCHPKKIYAQGGSAGGLLMGAVANLAPYRWKGLVAEVPFVDVVTTMLDTSIPLTVGEYEEWGDPNEEKYYSYMLRYSPYDNIHPTNYPAMFITTGYHDSQVQYWEPLKWVAKLRATRTNDVPLLFECDLHAGHGGASGRTNERIELAKIHAFLLSMEK